MISAHLDPIFGPTFSNVSFLKLNLLKNSLSLKSDSESGSLTELSLSEFLPFYKFLLTFAANVATISSISVPCFPLLAMPPSSDLMGPLHFCLVRGLSVRAGADLSLPSGSDSVFPYAVS